MENIFETVTVRAAGISADHPLASVIAGRANIFELTEKSHDAALTPVPSGGLSHAERAALACRIARLNNEDVLAMHYEGMIGDVEGSDLASTIANSAFRGGDNVRLGAIIRHTDLVATNPRATVEEDISALKSAGVSEQDIVRLSELIAFTSYQIRVVAALRLMADVA